MEANASIFIGLIMSLEPFEKFVRKRKRRLHHLENNLTSKLLMDRVFKADNEYDNWRIHFKDSRGSRFLSLYYRSHDDTSAVYCYNREPMDVRICNGNTIEYFNHNHCNILIDDLYDESTVFNLRMLHENLDLMVRYKDFFKNLEVLKVGIYQKLGSQNLEKEHVKENNLDIGDLRCLLSI